jgi:hypothetical protein
MAALPALDVEGVDDEDELELLHPTAMNARARPMPVAVAILRMIRSCFA